MVLSHLQLCLAKALHLARSPNVNLTYELSVTLKPGESFVDVIARVLRADVTAGAYRVRIFCDETAVLTGPEGETDRIYGIKRREGDDGTPGGIALERHTDAPAWATEELLDRLMEAGATL